MTAKSLKSWLFFLAGLLLCFQVFAKGPVSPDEIAVTQLPREARQTLLLIRQGGPFPYAKDGAVFGNYEGILPRRKRGYYHEYTVPTPGKRNRGARRIVAGGDPVTSGEYYYTDDHYSTFKRIKE
ncbi:ribonuclease [Noviherbaspirillum cavernae]|uniref:Ribonuclease n=1 Tax=Noviherbaspirillum cavernae TaxID=2320862 RepID=A0A418X2W7_9BURK|nr:ribonuclease [Noviherbaspirillum cavernae]RJG06765.1 ribonuclease [Noviherbaspirillum cavernae]